MVGRIEKKKCGSSSSSGRRMMTPSLARGAAFPFRLNPTGKTKGRGEGNACATSKDVQAL